MTYWNQFVVRMHTEMHTYPEYEREINGNISKIFVYQRCGLVIAMVLGIFSACAGFFKNVQIPKR